MNSTPAVVQVLFESASVHDFCIGNLTVVYTDVVQNGYRERK